MHGKCTDYRVCFLREIERPVWDDVTCVDWRGDCIVLTRHAPGRREERGGGQTSCWPEGRPQTGTGDTSGKHKMPLALSQKSCPSSDRVLMQPLSGGSG